jgi:hypothetical protein
LPDDNGTSFSNDSEYIDNTQINKSTQTNLDGIQVSRMLETFLVLDRALGKDETSMLTNHANSIINNITD